MESNFELLLGRLHSGSVAEQIVKHLMRLPEESWPDQVNSLAAVMIELQLGQHAEPEGESGK